MQTLRLETENGALATYCDVPPFTKLPEVVFWGERVFRLAGYTFAFHARRFVPRYREAFAVAVVDLATPRDRVSGGRQGVVATQARIAARERAETIGGAYQLGNRGIGF